MAWKQISYFFVKGIRKEISYFYEMNRNIIPILATMKHQGSFELQVKHSAAHLPLLFCRFLWSFENYLAF